MLLGPVAGDRPGLTRALGRFGLRDGQASAPVCRMGQVVKCQSRDLCQSRLVDDAGRFQLRCPGR
ncbi:hypothetical protein AMK31_35210 [Streptomyces sp. TSRI0107]|nr:hypothetical protein AMK31_35210 [Streptomyces sp. TSRI0107]